MEDIVSWISRELRKVDIDYDVRDRQRVTKVVCEAFDHWLDKNMIWTRCKAVRSFSTYLQQMPSSIDRHEDPYRLVEMLFERIERKMQNIHAFPTWAVLHVEMVGGVVRIEQSEDFRIIEFMKQNWKKYGCPEPGW